jgi:hypothetical protein
MAQSGDGHEVGGDRASVLQRAIGVTLGLNLPHHILGKPERSYRVTRHDFGILFNISMMPNPHHLFLPGALLTFIN